MVHYFFPNYSTCIPRNCSISNRHLQQQNSWHRDSNLWIALIAAITVCLTVTSFTSARAETPYLVSDIAASPPELTITAGLGSALFGLSTDENGALYLYKKAETDLEFSPFRKIVETGNPYPWSLTSIDVGRELLLIEYSSEASNRNSLMLWDGTDAAPKGLPANIPRDFWGVFEGLLVFYDEDSNSDNTARIVTINPSTLATEELHNGGSLEFVSTASSRLVFIAQSVVNDTTELFSSDGTRANTSKIATFDRDYDPRISTVADKTIFQLGDKLLVTDGSANGTRVLFDLSNPNVPGLRDAGRSISYCPSYRSESATVIGSYLLLMVSADSRDTADEWQELWQIPLSTGQAKLVKSLPIGFDCGGVSRVGDLGLIALTSDSFTGSMRSLLWSSDGSESGTKQLLERADSLIRFEDSEYSVKLDPIGRNALVFVYQRHSDDLYVTDGSVDGTRNLGSFYNIDSRTAQLGSETFFMAMAQPGSSSFSLLKTDGSIEGTIPVVSDKDKAPVMAQGLEKLASKLQVVGNGGKLWDLTKGSKTATFRGYRTRSGDSGTASSWLSVHATHRGQFLVSDRGISLFGEKLFATSGEPESLKYLPDIPGSAYSFTSIGEHLYFSAAQGDRLYYWGSTTFGTEYLGTFYRSDLTPEGTKELGTFGIPYVATDRNGHLTRPAGQVAAVGNRYLFAAKDSDGPGLFSTDGSQSGMRKVNLDVRRGEAFPMLGDFAIAQTFDYETWRASYWKTDGTPEGTKLTEITTLNPDHHVVMNGVIYSLVEATNDQEQRIWELWRTDGTGTGTTLVKELPCDSTFVSQMVTLDSKVVFLCGVGPTTLWSSNGTAEGTQMLRSWEGLDQGDWSQEAAHSLTAGSDRLYIMLVGADAKFFELWRSGATAESTSLVKRWDFTGPYPPWGANWTYGSGVFMDSTFYLTVMNSTTGSFDIWKTNGTQAGTRLAFDIPADSFYSIGRDLMTNGERVLFAADDGMVGTELWAFTNKNLEDQCPNDLRKLKPGVCGCGKAEIDRDSDGVVDCLESFGDAPPAKPTPTPTPTPTPSPSPTPTPQIPVGTQDTSKIAGMAVGRPVVKQLFASVVVSMQSMQGVQYKISYTVVPANAPKKKKFPTKVITSSKPETVLGKFKVGTTLSISYKIASGAQESQSSQVVRYKVKALKKK